MPAIELSAQQLQTILEAVVAKAKELNPLEQRKYEETLAKERRRDMLAVQLGRTEEEATARKRNACSHMRYPATAGKLAGHGAPKGTPGAEWTTGGQAYQNGLAMLFCTRCTSSWWFKPSPEFFQMIVQNGLENQAPPPEEHCVCIGCYNLKSKCDCAEQAKEYAAAHPTVA